MSYNVSKIQPKEKLDAHRNELLLWVIHANKIPPHIGLSQNNKFYSLKANGLDKGVKTESLESVVHDRKIQTLIFVLKKSINDLEITFTKFERTVPGKITCLEPIKNLLGYLNAEKIHHLIDELRGNDEIECCIGINIPNDFEGVPDYELADIHNRLSLLNDEA